MSSLPKPTRLYFLDNIKVFFVLLVIFYHAAVTYGVEGWWYYLAKLNENLITDMQLLNELNSLIFLFLTIVGALFQASLMGLFFLLGGYFTPGSYYRKGALSYWKNRLFRLGTPLVLYIVIIDPFMVYSLAMLGVRDWSTLIQTSFVDFYLSRFKSINGIIEFLSSTGPMWFLTVLLLLTLGYTIWTQIIQLEFIKTSIPYEIQIPRIMMLLLLSLILGLLTFFIRLIFPVGEVIIGIPFAFAIQYITMFTVGVISYRNNWFEKMENSNIKKWIVIIMASAFFFILYIIFIYGLESDLTLIAGSLTLHSLVYAMVDNIICMGMIFVLIPIFRNKFNSQGNIAKNLSINAYNMYLLHAPMLVLVSLLFSLVTILPIIKLCLVSIITIIICFLASNFFLKRIF